MTFSKDLKLQLIKHSFRVVVCTSGEVWNIFPDVFYLFNTLIMLPWKQKVQVS